MKIFMACDVLLDGKDAQTTHVLELFKNLTGIHDIYLFAPKPKKPVTEAQNVIFVPSVMPISKFLFYQMFLFFYLVYYHFKLFPDMLYIRQHTLNFSPLFISKIFQIPYVVELNGLLIDEIKIGNKPKSHIRIRIAKLNEKLNYKHARKIVAVTQGVKKGIMELYELPDEKIVVIENGANTELFKPTNQKNAKNELNFDHNANYVCFVGTLAPWQGVEFLIQSAPSILNENLNTKFLIIGDGPMKEELINLAEKTGISDKFIFTGVVPYEEVPKYINASDVCVAPFIKARNAKIGLSPLKMYEYMACGKPIVASNISGVGDVLEQNNTGISVEPENPEELAKAIIKLLKDEKLREEMGKNGRAYVVKNHSWESVARKVAEVCESTVREHRTKRR